MAFIFKDLLPKVFRFNYQSQYIRNKLMPCVSTIDSHNKFYSNVPTPYEIINDLNEKKSNEYIINTVKNLTNDNKEGRIYAVVHVAGKQFKITSGDVIVVEGYWPPEIGDKITLDKVLLAGSQDFTLIGRPIVQKGLIQVNATVIEKTLSHTKTHFKKKRRKQYMRINFYRIPQTYLRINDIKIEAEINNPKEVRGLDSVIL
ncbi:mitochondrial ribosomal protein L21 [Leptinotarsa decemlineata]|uniref:mitochondrial ribosomal protein L21 n=1 Tax=Leptinotarsa decemlineata TaxID=7539 RepID=UPI003D30A91C